LNHFAATLVEIILRNVDPLNLVMPELKFASGTIPWTQLIQNQHAKYFGGNCHGLILRDGASESELDALDLQLYTTHNGVGDTYGSEPNSINWSFTPISLIPELTNIARHWFEGTHSDLAARFFPFFNWGCGDYTGYLMSPDGTLLEGLYCFQHEEYQFDVNQAPEDFLIMTDKCIADTLTLP
jgi:hypothetical protein